MPADVFFGIRLWVQGALGEQRGGQRGGNRGPAGAANTARSGALATLSAHAAVPSATSCFLLPSGKDDVLSAMTSTFFNEGYVAVPTPVNQDDYKGRLMLLPGARRGHVPARVCWLRKGWRMHECRAGHPTLPSTHHCRCRASACRQPQAAAVQPRAQPQRDHDERQPILRLVSQVSEPSCRPVGAAAAAAAAERRLLSPLPCCRAMVAMARAQGAEFVIVDLGPHTDTIHKAGEGPLGRGTLGRRVAGGSAGGRSPPPALPPNPPPPPLTPNTEHPHELRRHPARGGSLYLLGV